MNLTHVSMFLPLCLYVHLLSTVLEDNNTFHGIHLTWHSNSIDNTAVKPNGGSETSSLSPHTMMVIITVLLRFFMTVQTTKAGVKFFSLSDHVVPHFVCQKTQKYPLN